MVEKKQVEDLFEEWVRKGKMPPQPMQDSQGQKISTKVGS